jgi:ATP-dependent Clp protease protease subunit
MSKIGTINIIGSISGDEWQGVSLLNVMNQVNECGEVDSYLVNINSQGGEVVEGYAIYNYLTSLGKPVTTRGIGLVASIATVIFLAGTTRELYASTQFLIHNPWSYGEGDASTLEKKAEELRTIENQLLDFYVKITGSDRGTLQTLMNEDKLVSSDIAQELKFSTVLLDSVKALASYKVKPKTNNAMSKIGKIIKSAFAELKNLGVVLNESVKATDGTELEVTMSGDAIAAGDTVTVGGENANGEYTLEDGTVIVCADGVITSVTAASALSDDGANDSVTIETLQASVTELTEKLNAATEQLTTLQNENTELVTNFEAVTNHLKTLKVNVAVPQARHSFNKGFKAEETKEDVAARIAELRNKTKSKTRIGI